MMVDDTALHARTSELPLEGDPPNLVGARRNIARMLPSMHAFVERAHDPEPMAPWNDEEPRWAPSHAGGGAHDLVDIPTFFFSPFEHVANEVAPLLHDDGDVRRFSVHELSGMCVTTSVLEHATLTTSLRTTSRFHDIEALVRGLDTALEWLGVDVRPPLEMSLDIDSERDGLIEPEHVTVTLLPALSGDARRSAVVLVNERTSEALVLVRSGRSASTFPLPFAKPTSA
jgi:hypothetical protein